MLSHSAVIALDFSGATFSLLATILCWRLNNCYWLLCIVCHIINFYLYLELELYADTGLDVVYLLLAFYGLFCWTSGKSSLKNVNDVQYMPIIKKSYVIACAFLICILIYLVLTKFTNSVVPLQDASSTSLSLIAQWLAAQKYIECWMFWFVGDIIYFVLYHQKHVNWHSFQHLIYLPLAISAIMKWHSIYLKGKKA